MKFIKLDLLTLLIGLFLLSSCKDANTIGLELDPTLSTKGTLNSTVTVKTVTEKDLPTSTLGKTRHPLGFINDDPTFGDTEATLSMAISLPATGYSFGKNPIIDSAILVLPYQISIDKASSKAINEFYGDTATSIYSFKVQQLKEDITFQTNFSSDREFAVETPVIGTFKAKISPNTPVKVNDIRVGKPDTIRTIVPELRIKLDNNFIQNQILNLDSITLAKYSRFYAAFKGLQVSVDKATATGKGGILMIDFVGSNANLQVYYKKDITNSVSKDTVGVSFPISATSGRVAATIKHDYTGTPVETQLNNPNPATPYSVSYLQGLTGLRTKLSFPDLSAFATTVKGTGTNSRIVVNRAELIVNIASGSDVSPFAPARKLALYRNDIAGNRVNLIDYTPSSVNAANHNYIGDDPLVSGKYDAINKRYVFVLTGYLQSLIDGNTEDYGTYLSVMGYDETALAPSILSPSRSSISSFNPVTGDKAIKLNIYYTKVN
ncbi:hypothetical protein ACVWYN_000525 [Pedobacter sp. UYP24]